MEKIQNLTGHSGCSISIYKDGLNFFIRKKSGTINYNYRLRQQCLKQKQFFLKICEFNARNDVRIGFFTPKIYRDGVEKGLYFFDMEYLNGNTLARKVQDADQCLMKAIAKTLCNLFLELKKESEIAKDTQTIFERKIRDLKLQMGDAEKFITPALDRLLMVDYSSVPQSFCLGDLSLENVLVDNDRLYFIDLLDSFFNSYLLDISKLLMDIECGWSLRNENLSIEAQIRLSIFRKIIIENLGDIISSTDVDMLNNLKTLHAIRIMPYTKDINSKLLLIKYITQKENYKCVL